MLEGLIDKVIFALEEEEKGEADARREILDAIGTGKLTVDEAIIRLKEL